MTKRIQRLMLFVIILAAIMSDISGYINPSSQDDKSVMRANAYLSHYASDPLITTIKKELEQNSEELGQIKYSRYVDRFAYVPNYLLANSIIFILEKTPLASAFQSVFVAELCIQALSLAVLVYSVKNFLPIFWPILLASLAISLLPIASNIYPLDFAAQNFSWITSAPRGSVALLVISLFIVWSNNEPAKVWIKAITISIILILGATVHFSTFVLLTGPGLLVIASWKILGTRLRERLRQGSPFEICGLYFMLLAASGTLKWGTLYLTNVQGMHFDTATIWLAGMVGSTLCLSGYAFRRLEDARSQGSILFGFFVLYLLLTSSVYIGFRFVGFQDALSFHLSPVVQYLAEITNRLSGIVHISFYILLGACVAILVADSGRKILPGEIIAGIMVVYFGFTPGFSLVLLAISLLSLAFFARGISDTTQRIKVFFICIIAGVVGFILHFQIAFLYSVIALVVSISIFVINKVALPKQRIHYFVWGTVLLCSLLCLMVVLNSLLNVVEWIGFDPAGLGLLPLVLLVGLIQYFIKTNFENIQDNPTLDFALVLNKTTLITFLLGFGFTLISSNLPSNLSAVGYLFGEIKFNYSLLVVGLAITSSLISIWLYLRNDVQIKMSIRYIFVLIFLVSVVRGYGTEIKLHKDNFDTIFDPYLLEVRISDLLADKGLRAFDMEVPFYQGISNELRAKNSNHSEN